MKDVEIKLRACVHTIHKNAIGELGTLTPEDLFVINDALEVRSDWTFGDDAKDTERVKAKVESLRENLRRWAIEQEIKD